MTLDQIAKPELALLDSVGEYKLQDGRLAKFYEVYAYQLALAVDDNVQKFAAKLMAQVTLINGQPVSAMDLIRLPAKDFLKMSEIAVKF